MKGTEPFKKLNEEEVVMAAKNAEAALAKQRTGIDTPGPARTKKDDTEKVEILMAPKEGPVTRDVAWDDSRPELKDVRGLICTANMCAIMCVNMILV